MEFEKVKKISQSHKDTVFGYLRNCHKSLFSSNNASYYQIPKPVQYSILLFYFESMESQILTPQEIDNLMELFSEQYKFKDIGAYEYKLLYASYTHGIGQKIFKKMCHGQKNLVVLVQTKEKLYSAAVDENESKFASKGNVWGGYTSKGWAVIDENRNFGTKECDDKAFIFSIRSRAKDPPRIFNVVKPTNALRNQKNYYAMFGHDRCYWIESDGKSGGTYNGTAGPYSTQEYESPPHSYYLVGSRNFDVLGIEVFQLQGIGHK